MEFKQFLLIVLIIWNLKYGESAPVMPTGTATSGVSVGRVEWILSISINQRPKLGQEEPHCSTVRAYIQILYTFCL